MSAELITCQTAGMPPNDSFKISVGRHVCGAIFDGVGIYISSRRGLFVVSWADFERAYEANKQLRATMPPPATSWDEVRATLLRPDASR